MNGCNYREEFIQSDSPLKKNSINDDSLLVSFKISSMVQSERIQGILEKWIIERKD